MIENLVVFALGALVATLFALLVIPVTWRRAARLIEQRIRATTPLTMAEIQSEKDAIRADYAVQLRKVEVRLDQAKRQAAQREIEISRRDSAITELQTELASRAETIGDIEVREEELKGNVLALERQVSLQTASLKEKQMAISAANDALRARTEELSGSTEAADSRKVEVASLTTQLENYKGRVAEMRAELAARSIAAEGHASEVDELTGVLKGRDAAIARLKDRNDLRRAISRKRRGQTKELEALLDRQRERVAEKTAALSAAELNKLKRDEDIKALEGEKSDLRRRIAELEAKLDLNEREMARNAGGAKRSVTAGGDKPSATAERARPQTMTPAETRKLRESISDLAARITRLAADQGDGEIRALIDAVSVDTRPSGGPAAKDAKPNGAGRVVKGGRKGRVPLAERIKEADLTPGE